MKLAKELFEEFHDRAGQSKSMGEYEFERALAEHDREIIGLINELRLSKKYKKFNLENLLKNIDGRKMFDKDYFDWGWENALLKLEQKIKEAL